MVFLELWLQLRMQASSHLTQRQASTASTALIHYSKSKTAT